MASPPCLQSPWRCILMISVNKAVGGDDQCVRPPPVQGAHSQLPHHRRLPGPGHQPSQRSYNVQRPKGQKGTTSRRGFYISIDTVYVHCQGEGCIVSVHWWEEGWVGLYIPTTNWFLKAREISRGKSLDFDDGSYSIVGPMVDNHRKPLKPMVAWPQNHQKTIETNVCLQPFHSMVMVP